MRVRFAALIALTLSIVPSGAAAQTGDLFAESLPDAQLDRSYRASVAGPGATSRWTFGVTSGRLPSGLTMTRSGDIGGIPLAAGSFLFGVSASSPESGTVQRTFQLEVVAYGAGLQIVTVALPNAQVGQPYVYTLIATGSPPMTWAVLEAPDWLLVTTDGLLDGTPTTVGTEALRVQVTDATGEVASRLFGLVVVGQQSLRIVDDTLPEAIWGQEYCSRASPVQLRAEGGEPPYTWSTASSPDGLTVGPDGIVCGTSTAADAAVFTARVTDVGGEVASRDFSVAVRFELPTPPQIKTNTLPAATLGRLYALKLDVESQAPPVRWRISEGRLPPGLALLDDEIVGTPSALGIYVFEIEAADAFATDEQALAIEVRPASDDTSRQLASVDASCRCMASRRSDGPANAAAPVFVAILLMGWRFGRRRLSK